MQKIDRFNLVLWPSLISGLVTVFISVAIIAAAVFSYISGNGLIYDYLFGPNSSAELIKQSRGTVATFSNTVFGNPTLNKVLYFAFWMLVGLVVYIILYTIFRSTSKVAEDINVATFKNAKINDILSNFGVRLAVRCGVALGWVLYTIFFIKILLPFSILCARIGAADFPSLTGILYGLLGLVVLVISIHLHLVFARLMALKVRLIDSPELVEPHHKHVAEKL